MRQFLRDLALLWHLTVVVAFIIITIYGNVLIYRGVSPDNDPSWFLPGWLFSGVYCFCLLCAAIGRSNGYHSVRKS